MGKYKSMRGRLDVLERKAAHMSQMIVMQDYDDPSLYHGQGETTYTGAELDALSAQGWQVVRIVFVDSKKGVREDA